MLIVTSANLKRERKEWAIEGLGRLGGGRKEIRGKSKDVSDRAEGSVYSLRGLIKRPGDYGFSHPRKQHSVYLADTVESWGRKCV